MADKGPAGSPDTGSPCVHGDYWFTTACLQLFPARRRLGGRSAPRARRGTPTWRFRRLGGVGAERLGAPGFVESGPKAPSGMIRSSGGFRFW
jgi:hypothetical protein